jgi:surfactin synthase thioesterase subunit/acyl carrier protein
LQGADPAQRRNLLLDLLQQRLARVLRRDAADLPDASANLFQLGMDSLLAVEFAYEINRSLGIRLPVETLLIHSTLAALADELPKHLDAAGSSSAGGSQRSAAPKTPWIAYCNPKPQSLVRLFCFHHLGGAASLYADWADAFPNEIEVVPIQLPGRESRQEETPITDFLELIETLSGELLEYVDRPFAFFGNSGGSLVAYELAQHLRRRFGLQPEILFAGGLWAPQLVAEKTANWTDVSDDLLGQLGLIPERHSPPAEEADRHSGNGAAVATVAQDLAQHVRGDFQLFASYQYESKPPLDCSITAFLGRDDELVSRSDILEWGRHTNSSFRLESFAGGHTTWHRSRPALVRTIVRDLMKDRGS